MYKAYKFRMCLTCNQKKLVNKTFDCTRLIYNYFLSKCKGKRLSERNII